jgi:hypothetical protein
MESSSPTPMQRNARFAAERAGGQAALGREIGVKRCTVSLWVLGRNEMSRRSSRKVAAYLGVPVQIVEYGNARTYLQEQLRADRAARVHAEG